MRMLKNNLGFPRIGNQRQLKKACEAYWAGKINSNELLKEGWKIKNENWKIQQEAGIDLIPFNDFSFYDHVLDLTFLLGAIPERYVEISREVKDASKLDLYFAMARGYQKNGLDIKAMEMTKWFDTNYHYIVPEFTAKQKFKLVSDSLITDFIYATQISGQNLKPVLVGPVSYLLLGKEKHDNKGETPFNRIDLIDQLIPVYIELINKFKNAGASWIQLDEPFLCLDLTDKEKKAFQTAYQAIAENCPEINILLTTYFEALADNTSLTVNLPVKALHIDLARAPEQLTSVLEEIQQSDIILSLGLVDGRNVWRNDYEKSLKLLQLAIESIGEERIMIGTSCSLIHSPCDLDLEKELQPEIKNWLAFAKQKLNELNEISVVYKTQRYDLLNKNKVAVLDRKNSKLIHNDTVKQALTTITASFSSRKSPFSKRQQAQSDRFKLPLFPTTTIGSFPQTAEVRQLRAKFKKGEISYEQYEDSLEKLTLECIRLQEEIGLDVLVHGEFERNDMVEYFGEMLEGFAFTKYGWVQSYGSRCVKPPIIYGDVRRPSDMTVKWSSFAQAHSDVPVKGMLTGPVTILQWSFVRDDQSRKET